MQTSTLNSLLEALKVLPTEFLVGARKLIKEELNSRLPVGSIDTSYDALVERFGKDGNNQLKLATEGHIEIIPQTVALDKTFPKFMLADLPFVAGYDNDLNAFAFEPTGAVKRKFTKSMSQDFVPHAIRLQVVGQYEILIDPSLAHESRIKVRNIDSGTIIPLNETLSVFVEWYKGVANRDAFEQVPFYPLPYGNHSLLSFNGLSTIRTVEWEGLTFNTAPYRTGTTINLNALSNIRQLQDVGEVPDTAKLSSPTVTSVYIRINDRLIRVMTANLPYARFVKSHLPNDHREILDLRAAINLTTGMEDTLGNVIEWTKLLGPEGLDLELTLQGNFDPETGITSFSKGNAQFFVHDERGDLLVPLLKDNVEVLAVSVDGTIA